MVPSRGGQAAARVPWVASVCAAQEIREGTGSIAVGRAGSRRQSRGSGREQKVE